MYLKRISLTIGLIMMSVTHHSVFARIVAGGAVTLNGRLSAWNEEISAKILQGDGYLDVKNITISCDEFHFTGTIRCDGECKIYVKKDFDHNIFKKEGTGSFTIFISPYKLENHTESTLLNKVEALFFEAPLSLTEESISRHLIDIRHQAYVNGLDENVIVQDIQQKIELFGSGIPVQLKKEANKTKANDVFRDCGLGLAGLAFATILFNKFDKNEPGIYIDEVRFHIGFLGIGSLGVIFMALKKFLTPEKLVTIPSEKLLLIQAILDQVFAQPYVSDVKVIKL
jgi:hypothetical protein